MGRRTQEKSATASPTPLSTCRPWRSSCGNLQLAHIPTWMCVSLFNTFQQWPPFLLESLFSLSLYMV
ncbi:mCG147467 [Mus musculus]|nr:mCG147467 [Mus musculus]